MNEIKTEDNVFRNYSVDEKKGMILNTEQEHMKFNNSLNLESNQNGFEFIKIFKE